VTVLQSSREQGVGAGRALIAFLLVLTVAIGLYAAAPTPAGPVGQPEQTEALPQVMGVVNESAEVRRAGETAWTQASTPISLHPGDAIRATGVVSTGVILRLPDGSQVQLMPGASVEAVAYAEADRRLRLRLLSGTVMVETANPFLQIETPATVAALRPGSFRVVMQGSDATVTVYRGTVVGTIGGTGAGAPGGATGVTEVPIGEGEEVRLSQGQAQAVRWQRPAAPTPAPVLTPTPVPTPMPTAGPAQRVHVVEQGDTLLYLGVKYRTTADAIARANKLADMDTLSIGQKLIIPPSLP
jgi:LysM repeat protein